MTHEAEEKLLKIRRELFPDHTYGPHILQLADDLALRAYRLGDAVELERRKK